jgi:hypothetical protein
MSRENSPLPSLHDAEAMCLEETHPVPSSLSASPLQQYGTPCPIRTFFLFPKVLCLPALNVELVYTVNGRDWHSRCRRASVIPDCETKAE